MGCQGSKDTKTQRPRDAHGGGAAARSGQRQGQGDAHSLTSPLTTSSVPHQWENNNNNNNNNNNRYNHHDHIQHSPGASPPPRRNNRTPEGSPKGPSPLQDNNNNNNSDHIIVEPIAITADHHHNNNNGSNSSSRGSYVVNDGSMTSHPLAVDYHANSTVFSLEAVQQQLMQGGAAAANTTTTGISSSSLTLLRRQGNTNINISASGGSNSLAPSSSRKSAGKDEEEAATDTDDECTYIDVEQRGRAAQAPRQHRGGGRSPAAHSPEYRSLEAYRYGTSDSNLYRNTNNNKNSYTYNKTTRMPRSYSCGSVPHNRPSNNHTQQQQQQHHRISSTATAGTTHSCSAYSVNSVGSRRYSSSVPTITLSVPSEYNYYNHSNSVRVLSLDVPPPRSILRTSTTVVEVPNEQQQQQGMFLPGVASSTHSTGDGSPFQTPRLQSGGRTRRALNKNNNNNNNNNNTTSNNNHHVSGGAAVGSRSLNNTPSSTPLQPSTPAPRCTSTKVPRMDFVLCAPAPVDANMPLSASTTTHRALQGNTSLNAHNSNTTNKKQQHNNINNNNSYSSNIINNNNRRHGGGSVVVQPAASVAATSVCASDLPPPDIMVIQPKRVGFSDT